MNEMINYNGDNPFRIFDYKNLGSVRTLLDDKGEVWFCLKDVCNILEINHVATVVNRLNPKGVVINYTLTNGGKQELTFINEPNLYETIFKSRKPEAEDLKRWVFNEVLPSIRRTGNYSMENDSSLPLEIRYVNGVTRAINNMNSRIQTMNSNIKIIDEREASHYRELSERADIAQHRQELIIEEGYHTVFQYAHFMGVDTNTIDTNHLGRVASKICREMGIPMGKYPDGKYMINTYPYKILNKVFNELVFTTQNSN